MYGYISFPANNHILIVINDIINILKNLVYLNTQFFKIIRIYLQFVVDWRFKLYIIIL